MSREPWRYNPAYNTAIDLDGCQFGFKIDHRCNVILCKFRTTKDLAPEKPMDIGRDVCPREREYESKETTIVKIPHTSLV